MARRPYPGLRAFRREEADLFFGRDEEIDTIVDRLTDNRFLGVLGASGSGKSSLVRTGLFEALHGGFAQMGANWRIVDCHPGGTPIANLAAELARASQKEGRGSDPSQVEAWLREGPLAIVEWCEAGYLDPGFKLLILVDQFEELFNYGTAADREDAHLLASLLVESARSGRAPIYVVITMRSDYFGACGTFPDLSDAISASLFLTPRMLRDACREAILCPAFVIGFEIRDELVTLLLNDMERFAPFGRGSPTGDAAVGGRQADQLPLMQYALNRMWKHASEHSDGPVELTPNDYIEIEGLEGALDKHGREIIADLAVGKNPISEDSVERAFRALVRGPNVDLAVRDPHRLSEIADISGLDLDTVTKVIEAFASEDCQFLRVAQGFADINHESLIRQWSKLATWVVKEAQAAEIWRSLAADTADWVRDGKPDSALLVGLLLARRREWFRSQSPTQAWADRYPILPRAGEKAVTVDNVAGFLAASVARATAEEQRATRFRRRLQLAGASALIAISGVSIAWAESARQTVAAEKALVGNLKEQTIRNKLYAEVQQRLRKEADLRTKEALIAKGIADANELKAKESARREALAAARAQSAAADARREARNAEAASAAMYATIERNILDLAESRADVQHAAAEVRTRAEQLAGQLDLSRAGRPTRTKSELGALAELIAGETIIGQAGTRLPPDDAAEYMDSVAGRVAGATNDPAIAARTALLRGRAAELRAKTAGDYEQALSLYRQAGTAVLSPRSAPDPQGLEATAALIRLHRRLGITDEARTLAAACAALEVPEAQSSAYLPVLECRAAAAELHLAEGKEKVATTILEDIDRRLKPARETAAGGAAAAGDELLETSLPRLKLRILTRHLLEKTGSLSTLSLSADDPLSAQARAYSDWNSGSEEASALYALALESKSSFLSDTSSYEVRLPLLETPTTSTGYLMDSLPLLAPPEDEIGVPLGSLLSAGSGIRTQINTLHRTGHLVYVLSELERRNAPEPNLPGGSGKPRAAVLTRAREQVESQAEEIDGLIKQAAEDRSLLRDLIDVPDVHLTLEDLQQMLQVADSLAAYKVACEDRTGHPKCGPHVEKTEKMIQPLLARLEGERMQPAESDDPLDTEERNWFRGYDVVAYTQAGRPVRGSSQFPLKFAGRTLLFASQANRAAFTESSLPRMGGAAIEWLEVGELASANPRFVCTVGGRSYLFRDRDSPDKWCAKAKGPLGAEMIRKLEATWQRLRGGVDPVVPKVELMDPVSGVAIAERPVARRHTLTADTVIRMPAAGRIASASGSMIVIEHADGSVSNLLTTDGEFQVARGAMLPKGAVLNLKRDPEAGEGILSWRVTDIVIDM